MARISLLLKLIMIKIKFLFLIHASKQLRRRRRRTQRWWVHSYSQDCDMYGAFATVFGQSKCFAHTKLSPCMTAQSEGEVIFGDQATILLDEEQFPIGIHGVCSHYVLRIAHMEMRLHSQASPCLYLTLYPCILKISNSDCVMVILDNLVCHSRLCWFFFTRTKCPLTVCFKLMLPLPTGNAARTLRPNFLRWGIFQCAHVSNTLE